MGKYAVKFHLAPKSDDVNNQNLKITVVGHWGNELEGEVMLTGEAAGVAIEVATTKKPHEFRVSYVPSP
jgi:translation elongation factor EF-1beta